jgi:DNA (cytosine-5)-methyltransferase 1
MGAQKNKTPAPKIIDLFSGAGGLSLGAARAGFDISAAVEIDKEFSSVHRANFPKTVHIDYDISTLSGAKLLSALELQRGDLAGVIGGPPCQGFSHIGKNDIRDPRNLLFVDFFRMVNEILPKFFLAENVPGIMNEKNSHIREKAIALVEKTYVLLPPMIMAAHKYGVPTTRTRVFFFGYLADDMEALAVPEFQPSDSVRKVRVKDALRGLPIKINPLWQAESDGWRVVRVQDSGHFASRLHGHVPPGVGDKNAIRRLKKENRASGCLGTRHSWKVSNRYSRIGQGKRDPVSKSQKLDPDGFCPTLRAGTGYDHGRFQAVRPLHPTQDRVITPREAARLQGFPDWYQFSPTKWHSFRQIGSSVSPILAERILAIIRTALGDNEAEEEK